MIEFRGIRNEEIVYGWLWARRKNNPLSCHEGVWAEGIYNMRVEI